MLLIVVFAAQETGTSPVVSGLAAYLVLLMLYGYAEVAVLHEAYFAVPAHLRSINGIQEEIQRRHNEQTQ